MARKLNSREKIALGLAAGIIGAILLLEGVVFPMLENRDRLQRQIVARTADLEEIRRLAGQYRRTEALARRQSAQLRRREKGFNLFSHLDTLAGQAKVKSRIAYMKPSTVRDSPDGPAMDRVELKIQRVAMAPLIRFIHGIESSNAMLRIRRLAISKAGQEDDGVSAVFQVETPSGKPESDAPPPAPPARG